MLRRPKATLTQSKRSAGNGSRSASHCATGATTPSSSSRSRPDREHRAVDVGEPHLARRPDAARERAREVARAAGDVEHAVARPHAAHRDRERLPQAVQAERHQVVHQVVLRRDRLEDAGDLAGLLASGTCSKPKCVSPACADQCVAQLPPRAAGLAVVSTSRLAPAASRRSRYSAHIRSRFTPSS